MNSFLFIYSVICCFVLAVKSDQLSQIIPNIITNISNKIISAGRTDTVPTTTSFSTTTSPSTHSGFSTITTDPDETPDEAEDEKEWYTDCWRTGCQPDTWAVVGCEQYNKTEFDKFPCEGGFEYQCCTIIGAGDLHLSSTTDIDMYLESLYKPKNEESKLPQYMDYVKGLLLASEGYSPYADPFPCTDIDPTKQYAIRDGDDAIRMCDLCPYFPFEKLKNVFLNINESFIWPNSLYIECVSHCLNETSCVALSYDSEEKTCYGFNTTAAETFDDPTYTTVIVTQPKGIIRDWLYTRNTKLTGNVTKVLTTKKFTECLNSCSKNRKHRCTAVSYEHSSGICKIFNTTSFDRVDYVYGHLAALNLNLTQGEGKHRWRFSLSNNLLDSNDRPVIQTQNDFPKGEFGLTYNEACKTQPLPGCHQQSGNQTCYYPEYKGSTTNQFPICSDSRYKTYEAIDLQKSLLEKCMAECTYSQECRAIDFSKEDSSCFKLDYKSLLTKQLHNRKPYILIHPLYENVVEKNFNLFFGMEIVQSEESRASILRTMETENEMECVSQCYTTAACYVVSFNWITRMCVISGGGVVSKIDKNAMTFSRKSDLMSPRLGFIYFFSTGITGPELQRYESECLQHNCQPNVDACLNACLGNPSCQFVGITYLYKSNIQAVCIHYDIDNTSIQWDSRQELYVRTAKSISFNIADLNKLAIFQPNDFWSCFRNYTGQTQSSLQSFPNDIDDVNLQETATKTKIFVRTKRGFWDSVGNFFKEAASAVISVVEDAVETVVKTGETVKKVFEGDFDGALETIQEIPIVQDGIHLVETGIQIVDDIKEGKWEDLGKDALDFGLTATSFIPGEGAASKIVGKAFKKGAKKEAKNVSKKNVKNTNKANKKKENNKDKNKDKDKNKNKNCQKPKPKPKAAAKKNKPGKANSNDKSCDTKKCTSTGVANIDTTYPENCNNIDVGKTCEFICKAGYLETEITPKCRENNDRPFWKPELQCDALKCSGTYVAVRIKTRMTIGKFNINSYRVRFDQTRKLPVYSIYYHDILQRQVGVSRKLKSKFNTFTAHPCQKLAGRQPTNDDFKMNIKTMETYGGKPPSWHKGHLTPFESQSFSYKSGISSNLFVNVAPQDPFTNQGPWASVENFLSCKNFLQHSAIVITGLCSGAKVTTATKLDVPDCFWKLVCYKHPTYGTTDVLGFIGENSITPSRDEKAKNERREETLKFRSQQDIIQRSGVDTRRAWISSAGHIFEGRGVTGAFNAINPIHCSEALKLPENLPKFSNKRKRGKQEKGGENKNDRAATFGCGANDMLETFAQFGDDDVDDSDDGDDSEIVDNEIGAGNSFSGGSCGKRLIGYYPSWGTARFTNVQGRALTHAVFAFFQTFEDGSIRLGTADPTNSKDPGEDLEIAKSRLANFKRIGSLFPDMKKMFAIGGWENSNYFSQIAANPQKRLTLIASALEIISDHNFDGIDIDWEHPVTGGATQGVPEDRQNYVTLMKEIRNAFNEHESQTGRTDHLLISFAGAAGQWTLDPGLDLPNLLKHADFANVMSYDYFGAWGSKWGAFTGPPSPLYYGNPKGHSGKVNADWTIKYYVCRTKEPHKVNMGVPLYGRFWKNVGDPIDPDDGMWRQAVAVNGVFEGGFMPWKEVKEWIKDPGFTVTMHAKAKAPYAWNPATKTFLGFENPQSLAFKVQYAEEKNLGGLMIWAIDQDDDDYSMLDTLLQANLCKETDPKKIDHRCPPINEKRWWTPEDGEDKQGMCGRSAPLYEGFYPVCDPDDPGYSCCGAFGFCGSGKEICDCPTCVDYLKNPEKILDEPIRPTVPINWYLLNDPDGKRGRCGRDSPLLNNQIPICNPDDENLHCCSNGGYCGASKDFCECDTCIDFKKNPNYVYKPKTWWSWSDGKDKALKCGKDAPKIDGKIAECDPGSNAYCCSQYGNCGQGPDFCNCSDCVNYKTR